jgi:hypothetical protein
VLRLSATNEAEPQAKSGEGRAPEWQKDDVSFVQQVREAAAGAIPRIRLKC